MPGGSVRLDMTHDAREQRFDEPTAMRRVEVALAESAGLPASLTYAVPAELDDAAQIGACVSVPLGARRVVGVVVGESPGDSPTTTPTTRREPRGTLTHAPICAASSSSAGTA